MGELLSELSENNRLFLEFIEYEWEESDVVEKYDWGVRIRREEGDVVINLVY